MIKIELYKIFCYDKAESNMTLYKKKWIQHDFVYILNRRLTIL